jgi:hypothetical protein
MKKMIPKLSDTPRSFAKCDFFFRKSSFFNKLVEAFASGCIE